MVPPMADFHKDVFVHDHGGKIFASGQMIQDVTAGPAEVLQVINHVIAQAHRGIRGVDLQREAKRVSVIVDNILKNSDVFINWEDIRNVIMAVSAKINTRGDVNASLELLDRLAYLLTKTTDPKNTMTVLAAIKLVSDAIVAEPLQRDATFVYVRAPYPMRVTGF